MLPSATTTTGSSKPRSCVVCRRRKVACDKQCPCSNCRRGNITCVFPSRDQPPRWTRNAAAAEALAPQAAKPDVMERLRSLEKLVRELSGQQGQIPVDAAGAIAGSSTVHRHHEDESASTGSVLEKEFGRLVLQNANHSRYMNSGFWARVNDEVRRLASFPTASLADLPTSWLCWIWTLKAW